MSKIWSILKQKNKWVVNCKIEKYHAIYFFSLVITQMIQQRIENWNWTDRKYNEKAWKDESSNF